MNLGLRSLAVFAVACAVVTATEILETVDDAEVEKLVRQEQFVIVLFCDSAAASKCEEFESVLAGVREDLVDSINAWVVKAVDSPLRVKYSTQGAPTIVFFRKQNPVLYDGAANEEDMLETLARYKDSCATELTDTNFEHLTQAATGATTGDWMVFFHKDECEACDRLQATVEALACKHKGRINVATVNRATTGAVTGRRFEVSAVPAFVFFRLGRLYRYEVEKYDVDSLSAFITGWYKNVKAESVPLPKSPFDDLVQLCADYIRDNPFTFALMLGLPVLLLAAFYFLMKSDEKPKSKKKKKDKST